MSRRVDRAFDRFRQCGDPHALGRVFDATAADLYRLAWHLTGDRHDAEDLVQTTFLVAIEDARRHAPQRDVLPWLCGILTNRARMRWRRQRTERDAAPLPREAAADPSETAHVRELSAVARARLHALPEPYRQACVLHVEHGLGALEIADALGRPQTTVRSQLQRGLDMLRRALPAALAAGPGAAPVASLPAVRARVLAHAPVPGNAPVLPSRLASARWVPAARHSSAVGATLACTLMAWVALRSAATGESAPGDAAASMPVANVIETAGLHATTTANPHREPVPAATRVDPTALLVVRVRWEADGAPAATVAVRFVPAGEEGDLHERVAVADAEGIARFPAPRAGLAMLHADRGGESEVEVRPAGATVAEVVVPRGVLVHGTVRDGEARPIAGASVWLSSAAMDRLLGETVATAAADGTFTIRDVAPDRLLSAWSERHGCAFAQVVPASHGSLWETELALVEEAPGRLHGCVLDEAGQPIANAKVLLGVPGHPIGWPHGEKLANAHLLPARTTSTDTAGRFTFAGLPCTADGVPLRACAPQRALVQSVVTIRGVARTTLTLAREAVLCGTACDRYGEPAWRGEVSVDDPELRRIRDRLPRWARAATAPARDGHFRLGHLGAGEQKVRAADGDDVAQADFMFRAGESVTWNAKLAEQVITGEVVDSLDRPLPNWRVSARGEHTSPLEGTTDRLGRFRLAGADTVTYEIAVREPLADLEVDGDAARVTSVTPRIPVRIVVPAAQRASARVGGRVVLPERWRDTRVGMILQPVPQDGSTWPRANARALRASDRFRSKLLRPGRYHLEFATAELGSLHVWPVVLRPEEVLDLGTLRFEVPGAFEVEIVAPPDDPCSHVVWRPDVSQPRVVDTSLRVAHGRVRVTGVQPGTHWVRTQMSRSGSPPAVVACGPALAGVRIEVISGATTTARLVVPTGVTRRICFPRSAPEADRGSDLPFSADATRWRFFDSDRALVHECGGYGSIRLESCAVRMPPGRYTIEASNERGGSARTEVVVQGVPQGADIVLPPPPPGR